MEHAIRNGEGTLVQGGALCAETGVHAGRSPKDKHVVVDALTENTVWWGGNRKLSGANLQLLHDDMIAHARGKTLYAQDLYGGANAKYRIKTRVFRRACLAFFVHSTNEGMTVNRVRAGCQAVLVGVSLTGAIALGSCTTIPVPDTQEGVPPITTATVQENASVQYYPSDEPLRLGLEHFNRGNFGVAEQYFRDAVEKAPKDASAWIGLAASYDRLGRFDLADRAYQSAIHLVGETTAILNNRGYSYMLRGNLVAARQNFLKALEREPGNPTILNNLKLLDGSQRFIARSPDAP